MVICIIWSRTLNASVTFGSTWDLGFLLNHSKITEKNWLIASRIRESTIYGFGGTTCDGFAINTSKIDVRYGPTTGILAKIA